MKFEIDTRHDQPRFVRAVVALILSALDDGSALPASVPPNLIPAPGEQLPDPQKVFGPLVPPVPSTAVAPTPPPVPAAPPVFSPPPPPASLPLAPPPAPVAPVPPAPVGAAPLASGVVALDVEGLPWDARIHAASKSKIANGTWKLKKGMSEQRPLVEGVKAELRNTMAIPAVAPAPVPPVMPPLPAPVPPLAPAAAADPVEFAGFMQWVAGLIHQGRWTHDHTTATLGRHSLPGAVALASRPDLIPQVVRDIKTQLGLA